MKIVKHTIQWRLWVWGQWVQDMRRHVQMVGGIPRQIGDMSQVGTIPPASWALDRNAAGSSGGIKYQIIDGVSVPPDGGMGAQIEKRGRYVAHDIRCRETNEAVAWLPDGMRRVIVDTYVVPGQGEPRSTAHVAARLCIEQKTVQEHLREAHKRLARRVYGPFEAADGDAGEQREAA